MPRKLIVLAGLKNYAPLFDYLEQVCFFLICAWWVFLFCSQYLSELLAEHQKLGPFMQVLPICSRLLNQGLLLPLSILDLGFSGFMSFPFFVSFKQHCYSYQMCFLMFLDRCDRVKHGYCFFSHNEAKLELILHSFCTFFLVKLCVQRGLIICK